MTLRSPSALERSVVRYSRCSGVSDVSASSSAMPNTPFIGVRTSWLMLARNSLLARLPASAARRASARTRPERVTDRPVTRATTMATPSAARAAIHCRCEARAMVSTAEVDAWPASSWARRVRVAMIGAMRRA